MTAPTSAFTNDWRAGYEAPLKSSEKVLAKLGKKLRRGGTSYWLFMQRGERYFARDTRGQRIDCASVDELRQMYSRFVGYGFIAA